MNDTESPLEGVVWHTLPDNHVCVGGEHKPFQMFVTRKQIYWFLKDKTPFCFEKHKKASLSSSLKYSEKILLISLVCSSHLFKQHTKS